MSINTNLKSFNRLVVPKNASKLETAGDSETQSDKCEIHENLLGISMAVRWWWWAYMHTLNQGSQLPWSIGEAVRKPGIWTSFFRSSLETSYSSLLLHAKYIPSKSTHIKHSWYWEQNLCDPTKCANKVSCQGYIYFPHHCYSNSHLRRQKFLRCELASA